MPLTSVFDSAAAFLANFGGVRPEKNKSADCAIPFMGANFLFKGTNYKPESEREISRGVELTQATEPRPIYGNTVYRLSERGTHEILSASRVLPQRMRRCLFLIDGFRTVRDLSYWMRASEIEDVFGDLERREYIIRVSDGDPGAVMHVPLTGPRSLRASRSLLSRICAIVWAGRRILWWARFTIARPIWTCALRCARSRMSWSPHSAGSRRSTS
jgi:hypothetical protein